jgi:hypothetical protein
MTLAEAPEEQPRLCLHCRGPIIGRYALAKYCCSGCRQKIGNAKWVKAKRERRAQKQAQDRQAR